VIHQVSYLWDSCRWSSLYQ